MKNRFGMFVLFAAAILSLLALSVFIWKDTSERNASLKDADARYAEISEQLSDLLEETQTEAASAEETVSPGLSAVRPVPGAAGEAVTEGQTEEMAPDHFVIFVGDSRTVGMGQAEAKLHPHDRCIYIGMSGEGYNWFIEEGMKQLDEALLANPGAPVVFNLGVNDCDKISSYINTYHEIEAGHPGTAFYYMSVNPVTEDSVHVPLSDILEFNAELKKAFPSQYIDTCSWMVRGGFEDVDGVHYTREQYCKIHDFAVSYLMENE